MISDGQKVSFSDFLHANTRAEKAEAERDAFREAASEEAWALAAAQDDLKHARHDRDGWMESALHAQKRVAGLEAELRRQMSGGAGRDVVNLLEKLKTTEELREAAEKTYCTWACGEDCHKELRELGRVLGFTADPA